MRLSEGSNVNTKFGVDVGANARRASSILVADRDYADLSAKAAALEERMKTSRAEHRADIERQANVFTWRVLIVVGIVGGLIIAAVRL